MATTVTDGGDRSGPTGRLSVVRSSALAAPVAVGCCLVAGTAYVTAVDPSEGGGFLPCPFRSLTGWWCPGCGLTRATHHLFRGDVVQALRYNVLVVVVAVSVVVSWALWLRRSVRSTPTPVLRRHLPPWAVGAAIGAAVAFAVLRNLPGVDGLRG